MSLFYYSLFVIIQRLSHTVFTRPCLPYPTAREELYAVFGMLSQRPFSVKA